MDAVTRRTFLDPATEARFRDEGFVILDLLTSEDVASLLRSYEAFRQHHEHDGFTATTLLDDLAARQRAHEEVEAVFRRRLMPVLDDHRIAVASYAVKQANSKHSHVGLHQDLTFVDEARQVGISIWSPLMDVNAENGWLGVAPRSHVLNSHYREPCSLPYWDLYEIIERQYLTYLPMRPGQVLLMDNRVIHGSPPNRTGLPRVVAAGVVVPAESQLLYCHREIGGDERVLEIWEVPSDFYVRHLIGRRPREGRHVATVPRTFAALTAQQLHAHYARS
jgi:phytanoyl-CoA dioxygenase PhyH